MGDHPSERPAADRIPAEIHSARDYEMLARRFIAEPTYEYIAGGSGRDETLAANLAAFSGSRICPRILRDVSAGSVSLNLAGRNYPHPIFLAPVAYQRLVHAAGEIETARGAAAAGSCMVSSTMASCGLEEIAAAGSDHKWFQLYFQSERDVTLDLVRRAEAAGYTAIVATLDAVIQTPSQRALRAGFQMPADCAPANLQRYSLPQENDAPLRRNRIFAELMRRAPTWSDMKWLLEQTTLPVWVKGVLHPADARELRDLGVTGVVVSNHGGRTLDGVPASLSALPGIRAAVGDDYPLMLDSGIRSGSDVFKALAMGADAVMVGRLQMYALGTAGALGVAHMIKLLREEMEVCMALTGCVTLADVRRTELWTC